MKQYHHLLNHVLAHGTNQEDERGRAYLSIFGHQERFDLADNQLPVITTNPLPFRWIAEELFWTLAGETNEHLLRAKSVQIWSMWASPEATSRIGLKDGDMGAFSGYQLRSFGGNYPSRDGCDQLSRLVADLTNNPNSRRHILALWNPTQTEETTLPPANALIQFQVEAEKSLNCHVFFRSFDAINYPHVITSHALLTLLLAYAVRLQPGELITSFGDTHVYREDLAIAREVLEREPLPSPQLEILDPDERLRGFFGLLNMRYEHLRLSDYKTHEQVCYITATQNT